MRRPLARRRSYLVYVDDDSQEDFLDWVQEEGCMPSTEETRVVSAAWAALAPC